MRYIVMLCVIYANFEYSKSFLIVFEQISHNVPIRLLLTWKKCLLREFTISYTSEYRIHVVKNWVNIQHWLYKHTSLGWWQQCNILNWNYSRPNSEVGKTKEAPIREYYEGTTITNPQEVPPSKKYSRRSRQLIIQM